MPIILDVVTSNSPVQRKKGTDALHYTVCKNRQIHQNLRRRLDAVLEYANPAVVLIAPITSKRSMASEESNGTTFQSRAPFRRRYTV